MKTELKLSYLYVMRKHHNFLKYSILKYHLVLLFLFKGLKNPRYFRLAWDIWSGRILQRSIKQQQYQAKIWPGEIWQADWPYQVFISNVHSISLGRRLPRTLTLWRSAQGVRAVTRGNIPISPYSTGMNSPVVVGSIQGSNLQSLRHAKYWSAPFPVDGNFPV